MPKNRIFYLDVLRVIACLSIVLIHSAGGYVVENIGSPNFWVGNALDSMARIGVPLFIMISGALMLDKNYSFSKKKLMRHIVRMVVFFVVWSAFYCLIFVVADEVFIKHQPISISDVILSFFGGHYHLWFVYLIVGLYFILPLLRLWVNDKNKKYVEYFIILALVFNFTIPQVISVAGNYNTLFEELNFILANHFQLKYVGGYTAYFILGWYINNYDIKYKKALYLLGLLGFVITFIGTYILSVTTEKPIQIYDASNINVFLQSAAVFILVKDKYINSEKNNKIIDSISEKSLGIYAIHVLFITFAFKTSDIIHISANAIITVPFVFVSALLLSYISSFILSKIPLIKEIV